jgi:hypothetical protein
MNSLGQKWSTFVIILWLLLLISENPWRIVGYILSKHTGACPRQHSQQLLWCVALDHLHLQEVEEQKLLSLIYPHKKKSQGVKCGLLGGQRVSAMFWSAERCLERIGLSYWYLSCDKTLTYKIFVTLSYKLKDIYYKHFKYCGYINNISVSIKRWKRLYLL